MAGRPKFGYKIVNGELVEDKDQQEIIQLMIDMKADGSTYAEITNYLNSEKIPTNKKNPEWTKRSVEYTLSLYKDEVQNRINQELTRLFGPVEEGSLEDNKIELPYEGKKRCGSAFDWDWVSKLPDGRYILEGYSFKYDDADKVHEIRKIISESISEKTASKLIQDYEKEHEAIHKMVEQHEERKRREPYKFNNGTLAKCHTVKDHVNDARESFEGWVDAINKPKIAKPATTKRKVRDIGRYLLHKLEEQIQWHLHLAQEVERLHSKIYSLEQELAKTKRN